MRILGALLLALALVGCGGDDVPTGLEADVAFAQGMIPHHADALVMVDMTVGRDTSPEFAALAEEIRATQTPEIETMVDWLEEWREEVPETSRDHVNAGHGDEHGDHASPEMDDLENAGADFESQWLTMMIEHHEGAIAMARTEIEHGKDKRAIALAKAIESAQRQEITTMKQLLKR